MAIAKLANNFWIADVFYIFDDLVGTPTVVKTSGTNDKDDDIGTNGGNGRNEYRFLRPSSHSFKFLASQSVVDIFSWFCVQALANVVHGTGSEDGTVPSLTTDAHFFVLRTFWASSGHALPHGYPVQASYIKLLRVFVENHSIVPCPIAISWVCLVILFAFLLVDTECGALTPMHEWVGRTKPAHRLWLQQPDLDLQWVYADEFPLQEKQFHLWP